MDTIRALILLAGVFSAAAANALDRFEFSRSGMGTTLRIVLYAADEPAARALAEKGFAEMDAVDAALSDYRAASDVSRISDAAGRDPVPVSSLTVDALRASLAFAAETGGAFDPTVAPLVLLWREARRSGKPPSRSAANAAFALIGYRDLAITPTAAHLARPRMRLDLGGIGKGFACDRALRALAAAGAPAALVSAGGDYAVGDAPPGIDGWRIQVEGGPVLSVTQCGISTSGDTEQHVVIGAHRYSHILDPRTGKPVEQMGLVTVVAENATASDALATAVSVLGPDAGFALAAGRAGTHARIRWRTGVETHTEVTPGFPALLAPPPFQFIEGSGFRELRAGDRPVWRTITADPEGAAANFKVYTHLYDPATGHLLTGARLTPYPHHRGLWVGWQHVHDAAGTYNFWEVPAASQRFAGFVPEREHADADEAVETARIEWTTSRGAVIVREVRALRARRAGPGQMRIDVTSELTAGGSSEVDLDGNGHHAGCQIRLSGSATELVWDRPTGAKHLGDDIWSGCEWTAAQFTLDGSRLSVLHTDDPGNPRPVEYSTRPYGRFGSRFAARLLPGVPQTFRWHLLIGPGSATAVPAESASASPPPGATVLFDGSDTSRWRHADGSPCHWTVANGVLTVKDGDLFTRFAVGDARIHVEFKLPPSPPGATDQARTNSGIYIQQRYEIQILDSFGDPPARNGCGAIYEQRPPRVNACRPAGEWQTYDIDFRQPVWNPDGSKKENARATVRLNGILIHQNAEITSKTGHGDPEGPAPQPLKLQDHGHPVSFRNIWIAPL